ncbi:MAG: CvpA family protein [Chloroflexota bacterium]
MDIGVVNGIDFLVIAIMAWGAIAGFFRGLFRQACNLTVLYLATILASQYYRPLARWVVGPSRLLTVQDYVLTFLGILAVTGVFLGLIALDVLRTYGSQRPLALKGLSELGGMALGFVQASLGVGLLMVLLSFAVGDSWWEWDAARQMLLGQMQDSALASLFRHYLSQTAITLLPWLPAGLPPVLISSL